MSMPTKALVITTEHSSSTRIRLPAFQERWAVTDAAFEVPLEVFMGQLGPGGVIGCFQSHINAMKSVDEPVLILEEDACFTPGFSIELNYPPDMELFYLGGEHLEPPKTHDPNVVEVVRIRRNHAYIVEHPQMIAAMLPDPPAGHIDRALVALQVKTYAVKPFTVGQAPGPSLINSKPRLEACFWND